MSAPDNHPIMPEPSPAPEQKPNSEFPPPIADTSPDRQPDLETLLRSIPWRRLLRWIVAGNPFYILSAVAMLYGIFLVSHEPGLASGEGRQLAFNFSSLQLYEWLLVVTAVLLGRRAIWYDSTLLVFLENLFVFVPFILIVQATLIDSQVTRLVCLAAAGMVAGRFGWLRLRWPGAGDFPRFLATLGALLLGLNLFLPLYFRRVLELDNEAWGRCSNAVWVIVLPALALAGNWLRPARERKVTHEMPRLAWFGALLLGLWLAGTAVHLAAVDYVASHPFKIWMATPLAWAALWAFASRAPEIAPGMNLCTRQVLLAAPGAAALGAIGSPQGGLFLALTALNALAYGWRWRRDREELAGHLCLASATALVAALPEWVVNLVLPAGPRAEWVLCALGAYLFGFACASRRLRGSVAGAVLVYWGTELVLGTGPGAGPLAMQNALVFFLLHSLRWTTPPHSGQQVLRLAAALAWTAHSVVWGYVTNGAAGGTIFLTGALVMAACAAWKLWRGVWPSWQVGGSAALVCLSTPVNLVFASLRITPTGYLVVLASFVLFGLGTLLALLKPRWPGLAQERAGQA